jgi:cell division protein FtsB
MVRLGRIVISGLVVAALYFAVLGGEYSLIAQVQTVRQQAAEAKALEQARTTLDSLRARADSLETDPELLERIARERYGLIRDGERLYRFVEVPEPVARPH